MQKTAPLLICYKIKVFKLSLSTIENISIIFIEKKHSFRIYKDVFYRSF